MSSRFPKTRVTLVKSRPVVSQSPMKRLNDDAARWGQFHAEYPPTRSALPANVKMALWPKVELIALTAEIACVV